MQHFKKNASMNEYLTYKKNLYEIIELWSSAEKQLEFQKKVPIAQVSHELFNDWDAYYANGIDFEKFLTEKEIKLFKDFNNTINKVCDSTPQILPEISEFINTAEWKIVNEKAKKILGNLKS